MISRLILFLIASVVVADAQGVLLGRRRQEQQASAAATPSQVFVPDLLWLPCTNGTGTTITAGVGPNATTDGAWITGVGGSNSAIYFNGSSTEATTDSQITFGTNIVTVAAWLNSSNWLSNIYSIFNCPADGTNRWVFVVNSFINSHIYGTSGERRERIPYMPSNVWTHILFVYDGSTANGDIGIWTNGVAVTTTVTVNTKAGTEAYAASVLRIAHLNDNFRWGGAMQDIRVYSGDQSASRSNIMEFR